MKSHLVTVLGREIPVRTSAPEEEVRRIESFVNTKIAEIEPLVRGGDPHAVAILALLNLAESYLLLEGKVSDSGINQRLNRLLDRLDQI